MRDSSQNMGKIHPSPLDPTKQNSGAGGLGGGSANQKNHNTTEYLETDEDKEFLDMIDLIDIERPFLDNALEKFEEVNFDSFIFCQAIPGHGIQYLMFKICNMYNLFNSFHFSLDKLINFTTEVIVLLNKCL